MDSSSRSREVAGHKMASKIAALRNTILSRRQIEGMIANGRKIVILDGQVIKADAWLPSHPGGEMPILHMVGRDGTDEIRALHSPEAQEYMKRYVIGRIQGRWINFVPPVQGGHFRFENEEEVQKEENNEAEEDSSSSSSAALTPIFDSIEPNGGGLRERRLAEDTSSISSTSSFPSLEDLPPPSMPVAEKTPMRSDITFDREDYPPLDPATQDVIVQKYRALNARIRAEGLYDCPYGSYLVELCRYSMLFASFILLLRTGHIYLSAASLGLMWHQLVFTAHDAGHMGITHSFHVDTCIGIFIADFMGGLSMGWWKRSHNVHHIVTNSPEHDPDSQLMPFFAISNRFFESLRSTYYNRIMTYDWLAKVTIPYQAWLYYPILTFGRFNLYRLSWAHLLFFPGPHKGPAWWHRYLEIVGQVFFWTWFGYFTVYKSITTGNLDRVIFVLISNMITSILHVQITLSHFAMPTDHDGVDENGAMAAKPNTFYESFPQRMLRTTMDVDCPQWLDFFHGGLQFQAVHHLFPRVPRHNLRRCRALVMDFCADVNIPYINFGFVEGNEKVISRLGEVAQQARILSQCRSVVAARTAEEVVSGKVHAH